MKLNKIILLGAILSATNIATAFAAERQAPPSNQDLQRQLDALKKMVTDQAREIAELRKSANLSPKPKENPSSPPISVPSKEIIDVYGYLRLDTIWDRSLPNNSQSPLYILSPSNPNKGSNANGGISIHPRLSRLGFNFNSATHDSSRIKVGGKLELDWQNGAGLTAESRPIP